MIELQILGEIRLRAGDGSELDALLRQPKRLALLAYLASPKPGTWHRRDMLLALFWPDLDAAHARTSLRNSVYVLRQALGDSVLRNRGDEEISIDPAMLETDLATVWDALRNNRPEEALANYRGELLPGLFPSDSDGFQRWLDTERTRLQVAVSTAAMAKVDELEKSGELTRALAIARGVIAINPDDETIVRRVMKLHESLGDRAGALTLFEGYRARLASDFEAEPSPETVALAKGMKEPASPVLPRKKPAKPASVEKTSATRLDLPPMPRKRRAALVGALLFGVAAMSAITALEMSRPARPATIGRSLPLTREEGLQVEVDISPNGRFVAYAKGYANNLKIYVQGTGGGAALPLTSDSLHVELMPRWSPHNDEILFLSNNNAYVSPALGGSARVVAKGAPDDSMVRSASWSPTGDSIAIVRNDSLFVQPLKGSGSRFVGKGRQLHSCVWSPDSTWIACVSGNWIAFTPGPLFGNAAPSSVIVFPSAGGKPVDITGDQFQNESPAWSADGKFLWFLSNRDGRDGESYAVSIGANGSAVSAPVSTGIRAESISLSEDRVAYSVSTKEANIWSVEIPRDTAVSMGSASQITTGNKVIEVVSASRDGKWLMYDSNRAGNADIYRRSIADGSEEQLTTDSAAEFAPELSPDGAEFAWHRYVKGKRHLFAKRLDSDSIQDVLAVSGDRGVPRWSPDGKSIVAWAHDFERGGVFVMHRDSRGQWGKPAWQLYFGQLPVWSPDGRTIAFVRLDGSIQTIPADSGALTTVYAPKPDEPKAIYLIWKTPDTIWMIGQTLRDEGIWSVSLTSGERKRLVRMEDPLVKTIGPGFASAGSRFYFSLNERTCNVQWAELTKH